MVLTGRFCQRTEPDTKFYFKNDFLITFSWKWWWHKTVFEKILNPSLLFYLFIRLHQWLTSKGNEGNLKIHTSSCVCTIIEWTRTSKCCTFFTSPSLFRWSRRKGLCILFDFCSFSWFNTAGSNFPWNIPLSQLKITVINVVTQFRSRFCVMLVLHDCIWKRIYWEKDIYRYIFVSDKTLFITTISKFVKVNSVHFKKKKKSIRNNVNWGAWDNWEQSQLGKISYLPQLGRVHQTDTIWAG